MINFAASKKKNVWICGMKTIWNALYKEFGRWKYYLIALAWLLLMVFFTYTAILSESMVAANSFASVHWTNQCTLISLIVNCGLLFMVIFDYMLAGKNIPHIVMWMVFFGIIFAIGIYGHTKILFASEVEKYEFPLNWSPLARCLHLFFLIVLLWLKERAVELDMSEVEIVDEY